MIEQKVAKIAKQQVGITPSSLRPWRTSVQNPNGPKIKS
jgi:hypothetical protein